MFTKQTIIFNKKLKRIERSILKLLVQFSFFQSVPIQSYAWSRRRTRMRSIPGLGTTTAVPFCSLQPRDIKQRQNRSFYHLARLQLLAKRSDGHKSCHVVLVIFIIEATLYIGFSNETPGICIVIPFR